MYQNVEVSEYDALKRLAAKKEEQNKKLIRLMMDALLAAEEALLDAPTTARVKLASRQINDVIVKVNAANFRGTKFKSSPVTKLTEDEVDAELGYIEDVCAGDKQ